MHAIFSSINALYRIVANGKGPPWYARPRLHTWQQTVAHHFRKLGWRNTGAWKWEHDECGEIDNELFAGQR